MKRLIVSQWAKFQLLSNSIIKVILKLNIGVIMFKYFILISSLLSNACFAYVYVSEITHKKVCHCGETIYEKHTKSNLSCCNPIEPPDIEEM